MTRLASTALLASVLLAACSAEEAPPPAGPRPVQIERVKSAGPQRTNEFVGRVEAVRTVDLAFQVGGQLAELPATDGLEVAEGDLIARLDLEDFRRAEREANVQLQQAQTDLERQQTLFDRGIASAAARDNAQTQFDLRLVALENARQNLADATLRAPFDGQVSRVLVENFTVVTPGRAVARLQDLSELRVSIPIPENLIATFREEDLVSIEASFAFLPGERYPLVPRELVSEVEAGSQTYRGILALPGDIPANILPGMTATVWSEFSSRAALPDSLMVPVTALAFDSSGEPVVFVFDSGTGRVSRRPVETGEITNEAVIITQGLAPGELIATAGVSALQDGMTVRPLDPLDTAAPVSRY
jgi:RND family efflux transporter MFP subunit